jgi:hypothetical protein
MARFCQAIARQKEFLCSDMHEEATKIARRGFSNMNNSFLNFKFSRPRKAHRRQSLTLQLIGNRRLPVAAIYTLNLETLCRQWGRLQPPIALLASAAHWPTPIGAFVAAATSLHS